MIDVFMSEAVTETRAALFHYYFFVPNEATRLAGEWSISLLPHLDQPCSRHGSLKTSPQQDENSKERTETRVREAFEVWTVIFGCFGRIDWLDFAFSCKCVGVCVCVSTPVSKGTHLATYAR